MIYLTGDTHGRFDRIVEFTKEYNTTKEDVLIILGDAGINYYGNSKGDIKLKKKLRNLPITLFSIKGNHENYAGNIDTYDEVEAFGGKVFIEKQFPTLIFAKDGEVYNFPTENGDVSAIAIGGAYSVDKFVRLIRGLKWFNDEQPSDEVKKAVWAKLESLGWKIDCVLAHTAPKRYEPREWFLPMIEQDTVDKSTEEWLDTIEERLDYKKWYCGHYHGSKTVDKMVFMYEDFRIL